MNPGTRIAAIAATLAATAVLLVGASACQTKPQPPEELVIEAFTGRASYYADELQGEATASGEALDQAAFTAAHRKLAFGTRLRVTNPASGAQVEVRVNDRGPFADDRVIDVSRAAAEPLGMLDAGVIDVRVEVLAHTKPVE